MNKVKKSKIISTGKINNLSFQYIRNMKENWD